MKPITYCRCGFSGGDHIRTAQCSEGRQTIRVPDGVPPESFDAIVKAALAAELDKGVAGFATNGRGDA